MKNLNAEIYHNKTSISIKVEIDVFINNIDSLNIVLLFTHVYKVRRFGLLSSVSLNDSSNPIADITVATINVTLTP